MNWCWLFFQAIGQQSSEMFFHVAGVFLFPCAVNAGGQLHPCQGAEECWNIWHSTLQYCPGMTCQDLSRAAHLRIILLYKSCLFPFRHSPDYRRSIRTPVDINSLTDTLWHLLLMLHIHIILMCMLDTSFPTGILILPSRFLRLFFLSALDEESNCRPLVFTYILVPLVLTSSLQCWNIWRILLRAPVLPWNDRSRSFSLRSFAYYSAK